MSKIQSLLIGFLLMFAMIGCSNMNNEVTDHQTNSDDQEIDEFNDDVSYEENDNSQDVKNDGEGLGTDEIDEREEKIEEQEQQEEIDPLYEISNVSSIIPIEGKSAPENVVLLTIDDVFLSANVYALEMAEILNELDTKAIFFVNGLFLDSEENKEKLKEIHRLGFEIGNHSMTHPNFSQISAEEQREEIVQLNDKVEEIIGERPRFFRAPFGVNTDTTREVVAAEGMQWMNWSYGFDFVSGYMDADALTEIMLDPGKDGENVSLSNGSNLLMHDRHFTRDALKGIVEGLREKGFEIVDPTLIK